MLKNTDIHIRDPFVLPDVAERRYYLYGTTGAETWTNAASGIDCYTGTDLQTWEGPFPAFRPPATFWADRNFWAPEVHVYRGRYTMFASFKAEGVRRGTQILAADSPQGPFLPVSDGPVTPRDWECLDGTLFVDASDRPWIVFCHEWVQVGDGEICALRLNDDLTSSIGQAHLLFHASEAPWAQGVNSRGRKGYVTDGPCLHRLANGELIMLWSSFSAGGYTVGIARSTSGDILGPWQQQPDPLYAGDGGHCMVFRTFDGQLRLAFHRPNPTPGERPHFVPLRETATSVELA
ncbi:glycoside hydrolase family 43 protein [Aggregatilinea lenta]|uniref:glycoside hydrolase family 43 protein n=1 Tax=Aggregatilinea lenta TaxID=913108 RepID=UPI000E5AE973|nr:glycoside hydrolase family 43 protein [Aggregatilinea lenta]